MRIKLLVTDKTPKCRQQTKLKTTRQNSRHTDKTQDIQTKLQASGYNSRYTDKTQDIQTKLKTYRQNFRQADITQDIQTKSSLAVKTADEPLELQIIPGI